MEKHIEKRKHVYHNFIGFKKSFDRVWNNGLWPNMEHVAISKEIIELIVLLELLLYASTISTFI